MSNYSSRRRAYGNNIAARQQRDAATVVINRVTQINVVVDESATSGVTAINHWYQLLMSDFYQHYSAMYDQMKIDRIRCKFTGNQNGTAAVVGNNMSPNVILAFDRNGLSGQQLVTATGLLNPSYTATEVSTYSSAQLKSWSTGNSFYMYQTIVPSTIMEKGQYIPPDSLVDPSEAGATDANNPCSLLTSPTLPFKPITLVAINMGGISTDSAAQTFSFLVELEYTVTFRGMRKPTVGYSGGEPIEAEPLLVSVTDEDVQRGSIVYNEGPYDPVTIDLTTIDIPELTSISKTFTANDTYIITPSSDAPDYDGFSSLTITVNVPSTPSTPQFTGILIDHDDTSSFVPFTSFTRTQTSISLQQRTGYQVMIFDRLAPQDEGYATFIRCRTLRYRGSGYGAVSVNPNSLYYEYQDVYESNDPDDPGEYPDSYVWLSFNDQTPVMSMQSMAPDTYLATPPLLFLPSLFSFSIT